MFRGNPPSIRVPAWGSTLCPVQVSLVWRLCQETSKGSDKGDHSFNDRGFEAVIFPNHELHPSLNLGLSYEILQKKRFLNIQETLSSASIFLFSSLLCGTLDGEVTGTNVLSIETHKRTTGDLGSFQKVQGGTVYPGQSCGITMSTPLRVAEGTREDTSNSSSTTSSLPYQSQCKNPPFQIKAPGISNW